MPIKVSCPQCQKAYILPDDKRGKQVRCQDCFQVFLAGRPPAGAPPEGAAPPEPPPAPARKPAARSAVKPAAAAAPRPAPKPAPKPPIRASAGVASNPGRSRAPARQAAPAEPPAPPRRRRKSSRGVMGLLFLLLLVLLAGGGAAALAFMALTGKLPFVAAVTLPDSHPAAPAPPKKDDKDPQTPNPPADAPKPAAGSLAASLTRENFDKIDRGVTDAVLVELFGPPTSTEESKQTGADKDLIWKVGGGPQVTVSMKGGRVVAKSSGQDWPVVYPSGVAANPPPDKDPTPPPEQPDPAKLAAAVTKATFDKIAKGMTEADLKKLLGPPNYRMPDPGVDGVDLMLAWRTPNRGDIPGPSITVFMAAGAVRDKLGGDANHWEVVWPSDVAANPPPPLPPPPPDNPGPGVTKDTYAKIAQGMSLAELTALLGPPTDVKKTPDVPAYDTYVTWQPGGLRGPTVIVTLKNDKTVLKDNLQQWPTNYPPYVAKNPSPPDQPTPGVNKNNYYRVTTGMADKDVIALFGPPFQARPGDRPNETFVTWMGNPGVVHVVFRDARVIIKDNDQKWSNLIGPDGAKDPPPERPAGALTKVDFDKIDRDMLLNDLNTLLGPPTSTPGKPANEVLTYKGEGYTIVVLVAQGKVLGKQSSQGWEVVYPADAAKNPPDDPRWSQENFDKIAKGMSLDDVTALLGPAGKAFTVPTADGDVEQIWESGGKQIVVTLRRGKVFDKADAQGWAVAWPGDVAKDPPPPPPPPDKPDPAKFAAAVTKDNFDKIAKGMTKDALTDLFGPPTDVKPQPQPGVDERLTWQGAGAKILVSVAGGKVVSKLTTADWPVVYPK